MNKAITGAMAVLALLGGSAAAQAEDRLTARGNEPFWRLELGETDLSFSLMGQDPPVKGTELSRSMVDGHPRITASTAKGPIEVTVIERLCADTMTGMPFPVGVEVSYAGQRYAGCGGDSMTAIEGGWRVIRLGGSMPPEGVILTIVFERDGKVSGKSGCNRFMGGYTLSGEGLALGPLGGTRMACPAPEMEAERQMLDLLSKVTRVTPGENAQLRLMAGDDEAMVLDRAD